jgi:anti-sigma factor RsiW
MTEPALPYFAAPDGLRERVQASIRTAQAPAKRDRVRMAWAAAAVAAMLALTTMALRVATSDDQPRAQIVAALDAHLRSLEPGHLADVASTDQHTVKPWFVGKLVFSPPVVDAAAAGYPLVGARTDIVAGQRVAALVYARRSHVINLFIRPLGAREPGVDQSTAIRGYTVLQWSDRDLQYAAISDLNAVELRRFAMQLERTLRDAGTARP